MYTTLAFASGGNLHTTPGNPLLLHGSAQTGGQPTIATALAFGSGPRAPNASTNTLHLFCHECVIMIKELLCKN